MSGFDALYKQTVTLFNRIDMLKAPAVVGEAVAGVTVVGGRVGDKRAYNTYWIPILLRNVHLIVDRSIIVSTYGEQAADNAKLHVRYFPSGEDAVIEGRRYYKPKEYARLALGDDAITFRFGDNFDFFIEGDFTSFGMVDDEEYRSGFYNYMNKMYDNVFAITNVAKFNLIPHFEIVAR